MARRRCQRSGVSNASKSTSQSAAAWVVKTLDSPLKTDGCPFAASSSCTCWPTLFRETSTAMSSGLTRRHSPVLLHNS